MRRGEREEERRGEGVGYILANVSSGTFRIGLAVDITLGVIASIGEV